jgi:hypothetical protein
MPTINLVLARATPTNSKRVAMPTTVPMNNHTTAAARTTTTDTTITSRTLAKRSVLRHSRTMVVKRGHVKAAHTRKT